MHDWNIMTTYEEPNKNLFIDQVQIDQATARFTYQIMVNKMFKSYHYFQINSLHLPIHFLFDKY